MPRAILSITLPEQVWVSDLSDHYPDAEFVVLATMPTNETGVGLVEIRAADIEPVVTTIGEHESVASVMILGTQPEHALVQFEMTEPLLILTLSGVGIPLELLITIVDGEMTVEVTAPRGDLSGLGEQLTQFGVPFDLVSTHQSISTESLPTDDQHDLLEAAVSEGYYDTPRTRALTELAETVGLTKSTTSEKLHQAEGKVMKAFLARNDATVRRVSVVGLVADGRPHRQELVQDRPRRRRRRK